MSRAPEAPEKPGPLGRLRRRVHAHRVGRILWRLGITAVGFGVIAVGIVLLAIPGPGWLVIFAGMGLPATEYAWARRLLRFAREQVGRWTEWVKRQSWVLQGLLGLVSFVFLAALAFGGYWFYAR